MPLRGGELDQALSLASGAVELAGPLRYMSGFHAVLLVGGHATDPLARRFTSLISAACPGLRLEGTRPSWGAWPRSARQLPVRADSVGSVCIQ